MKNYYKKVCCLLSPRLRNILLLKEILSDKINLAQAVSLWENDEDDFEMGIAFMCLLSLTENNEFTPQEIQSKIHECLTCLQN